MDTVYKEIKKIAEDNHLEEVCGFVLEKDGKLFVQEAYNEAENKEELFQINPIQYLKAFKASDEIIAVFHSHPQGAADPSSFDIEMAKHCCLDFLIYSLEFDEFKLHKYND
tara:strand:+ start:708 stop:1040 length:333 start_codon:yes stop_codon:yes gene_type:complete